MQFNNFLTAMICTTISGLSTAIGGIVVYLFGEPNYKTLGKMLSFSAGVMIYVSFVDILGESVESSGFVLTNTSFFIGMVLFVLLVKFIPEPNVEKFLPKQKSDDENAEKTKNSKNNKIGKKASENREENEVVNRSKKTEKIDDENESEDENSENKEVKENNENNKNNNNKEIKENKDDLEKRKEQQSLLLLGIKTAFSICLHNFPEGIAVYMACLNGVETGIPLMFVIAAHNIPEGLAVAAPIYSSTGSKWEAFKWALISGICEPLGALTVGALCYSFLTETVIDVCLCAVSGIMVYMTIMELIPSALKYLKEEDVAKWFAIGMSFMAVGIYFMQMYSL